jgi:ribonuclease HII
MLKMVRCGLVGVDETGRGSLFGPVVTCAVAFPEGGLPAPIAESLADSKVLSARARERIAAELARLVHYAFGAASAAEVDLVNPLRATMIAMARAVSRLSPPTGSTVIVDGPHAPILEFPTTAMIRADSQVAEVMAASILAKVFRDRLIASLAIRHPGYGLERHAGYGTRAHAEALTVLGPTRHHRLTFLRRICEPRPPAVGELAAGEVAVRRLLPVREPSR